MHIPNACSRLRLNRAGWRTLPLVPPSLVRFLERTLNPSKRQFRDPAGRSDGRPSLARPKPEHVFLIYTCPRGNIRALLLFFFAPRPFSNDPQARDETLFYTSIVYAIYNITRIVTIYCSIMLLRRKEANNNFWRAAQRENKTGEI